MNIHSTQDGTYINLDLVSHYFIEEIDATSQEFAFWVCANIPGITPFLLKGFDAREEAQIYLNTVVCHWGC